MPPPDPAVGAALHPHAAGGPQSHHPIAAKLRDDELARLLEAIRSEVRQTVAGLSAHQDYVARNCGAAVPQAA